MTVGFWEQRYRSSDRLFSGEPNGALVAEVAGLAPGQALDVGCGEGADALWLARRGWLVTAVDISRTALERAAAADDTGRVAWTRADLATARWPAGTFDLVSVHYVPLPRVPGDGPLLGLLAAVAPGGTLLFVSHDLAGLDSGDYYRSADVTALLGGDWTILVDEVRPRRTPEGSPHTRDTVLRARRLR
ncbi:Methyltransferase domain-containing protein [Amycolatopsis sacchari]|uniref:Methyltransferase domain-containing protein n=1 Tax=Amycolatopsis sacchari TaxID=115433 RepID=A0A1I3QF40_9PSEU|nr:class I SAM-dependent methyltransferase [Amycolatopsis sacchari]SFJ32159.1 Methyltransferase domain-containing protein [Amycolatopsis sacchari]